jgi:hypothetical protein
LPSIELAIAEVQKIRRQPAHAGEPISITLHSGTYFLPKAIRIPAEAGPLTITAPPGQSVVISGGTAIAGWKPATFNGHACWAADVPEVGMGLWDFHELWINGKRATRARHPAHGYLAVVIHADKNQPWNQPWNQGQDWFGYKPGDLPDALPADAEAIIANRWVEARLSMLTVDPRTHIVHSRRTTPFALENGDPYWLEGAPQWLTEPGEWYLDRQAGTVYYLPKPGEQISTLSAVAPRLATVVEMNGAENVTFSGITFSHTEWNLPEATAAGPELSGGFGQAAVQVPAAVIAQNAHDCRFERCVFEHVGGCGLELGRGCQNDRVDRCTFTDLGAGGLKIGDGNAETPLAGQAFGNVVADCRITDGGHVFPSACGIWVGESYGNHIEHNEIADLYYTGISMGWTWGYGPSLCRDNHVEGNLIHHIGKKSDGDGPILSDMGGIYTLGMQPGTVISGNVFHDIAARVYGGWGIYLDEGSSNIVIEKNLVYRTTHGEFHQHYGRDNVLRNNIFALGRDMQIARTRVESSRSFTFTRNIVYWNSGIFTATEPRGLEFDDNLYDCTGNGQLKFGDKTWDEWRAAGMDKNSVLADPHFRNVRQDDYTPSPAAAARIGFEPLELRTVGPRLNNPAVGNEK